MKKTISTACILLTFSITHAQNPFRGEQCIVTSEFIYQPADVNFPGCHASTIAQTKEGLLAAWFGGTAESNPDVGIWTSRYLNGKWSGPVEAADGVQHKDKRYPCWNPVLHNTGKEMLLFYKVGPSPSEWWGELIVSADDGKSWAVPRRLPEDILGPVKNKPVLLENGELLCPSSSENDGWRVHMEFTSDDGLSWERTPSLNNKDTEVIQPSILLHPGGKLQMVCRSRHSQILTAWSKDKGRNWTGLIPFGLPNPNSGIDAVTMKDGRHLLVYNHIVSGRYMLNVAVSENGNDWSAALLLENDNIKSEYSYPAIIQTTDGLVHITYTWNRRLIKHVVVDPSKITAKPFSGDKWPEA